MDTPRLTLLEVPNHHVTTDGGANHPPAFDESRDFVAYSPNRHGEQMVFVQRRGEQEATLYHGDYAWQPVRVVRGIPIGLTAHSAEYLFVATCWLQSKDFRRDTRTDPNSPIVDALGNLGASIHQLALLESLARAGARDASA